MAGAEVAPGLPAGVGSQGGFRAGEPQAPLLISRSCLWLWGGEGAATEMAGNGSGLGWVGEGGLARGGGGRAFAGRTRAALPASRRPGSLAGPALEGGPQAV